VLFRQQRIERGLFHYPEFLKYRGAVFRLDAHHAEDGLHCRIVETGMNNARGGHRRDRDRAPLRGQCEEYLQGTPVLRVDVEATLFLLLASLFDICLTGTESHKGRSDARIDPGFIDRYSCPPPRRVNQFFISAPELF
jgi:hypothetical protein